MAYFQTDWMFWGSRGINSREDSRYRYDMYNRRGPVVRAPKHEVNKTKIRSEGRTYR